MAELAPRGTNTTLGRARFHEADALPQHQEEKGSPGSQEEAADQGPLRPAWSLTRSPITPTPGSIPPFRIPIAFKSDVTMGNIGALAS